MYKRRWTAPTIGRSRRGPPWPIGRLKRPVPNVRGGGPVPNGLTDSPGGDLGGQPVPFTDPNANYANYGMPNPSLPQQLRQLPPEELQQLERLPPQQLQQFLQQMPPQLPEQMACGGVVTKPTVAVVGEREPEAVVKLRPRMSYQRKE